MKIMKTYFDVQVHDVFDNKNKLQKRLHFMMIRTKYQFKVHKSSPRLLVMHCMDDNCDWRVRGKQVMNTEYWMVTKFEKPFWSM